MSISLICEGICMGISAARALFPKNTLKLVFGATAVGASVTSAVICIKSYYYRQIVDEIIKVKDGINTYTYISPTQTVVDKKGDIDRYKTIGMDSSAKFDYLKVATRNSDSKLQ